MSITKDVLQQRWLHDIEMRYGVERIHAYPAPEGASVVNWVWWKAGGGMDPPLDKWHSVETDSDFETALPVLIAAIRMST